MDEEKLTVLKTQMHQVSLTPAELARGRDALAAYMTYRPIRDAGAQTASARFGFWQSTIGKPASIFAASFLLFATLGGVSYAAEGALPGERLYAVKVGFNEEVRRFVAWSPEDRAMWEGERASRRLYEAEELAREGMLKMETRVALDKSFREHAAHAETLLARVRLATDGYGIAADATAHIEGSWRAHRKVMQAIVDDRRSAFAEGEDGTEGGAYGQVAQLAASVDAEADSASRWLAEAEATTGGRADAAMESLVAGRRSVASSRIASTRSWLLGSRIDADLRKQATSALAQADAAVVKGNDAIAKGEYSVAFSAFASAQRLAQEVKTAVAASSRLKVHVRLFADAVPVVPTVEVDSEVKATVPAADSAKPGDTRKPTYRKPTNDRPAAPSGDAPAVTAPVIVVPALLPPPPAEETPNAPATDVDSEVETPSVPSEPAIEVPIISEAELPTEPPPAIVIPELPPVVPSLPSLPSSGGSDSSGGIKLPLGL